MSLPTRFRRAFYKLVPTWLSSDEGELALYSLNVILDAFAERTRLATLARFPTYAPTDAQNALGRDRLIKRGRGEADAPYAIRLLRWLTDHRSRGTAHTLMDQIRAYCQHDVIQRTVDRAGNWDTRAADGTYTHVRAAGNWNWDSQAATRWARAWFVIYPEGLWDTDGLWGDPGTWGDGGTWGTTATVADVAAIKAIVRDWRPLHAHREWIIIAFDSASFDPTAPEPDGTWYYDGHQVVWNYEQGRLDTARFWTGS